jgi:hypothetical protein
MTEREDHSVSLLGRLAVILRTTEEDEESRCVKEYCQRKE